MQSVRAVGLVWIQDILLLHWTGKLLICLPSLPYIAFSQLALSGFNPLSLVMNTQYLSWVPQNVELESVSTAHILMPSSSMYLGRISRPRLEILPLGLEMLCNKNGGFFHKTNGLCRWDLRF